MGAEIKQIAISQRLECVPAPTPIFGLLLKRCQELQEIRGPHRLRMAHILSARALMLLRKQVRATRKAVVAPVLWICAYQLG